MLKLIENFITFVNQRLFLFMQKITHLFLVLILFGVFLTPILAHENEDPVRVLEVGDSVPNINLIDQDEQDFVLESVRGKVVLLSFMYTKCPDVCPLQTTKMRQTQEILGDRLADNVVFVSISFDTDDTPAILKGYALFYKADLSSWKFLGSQDEHEIKDTVESLGITYEKSVEGLFSHGRFLYLLDTNLTVSNLYLGQFLDTYELVNDISALLPTSTDWTTSIIAGVFASIAIVGSIFFFKKKR